MRRLTSRFSGGAERRWLQPVLDGAADCVLLSCALKDLNGLLVDLLDSLHFESDLLGAIA